MIIFLHGKDTYRSRAQLRKMVEKFKKDRDPQGLNVVHIDVEKNPDLVLQEVLGVPFLAERKMIVLENLMISKHKELMGELLARVEDGKLPESNIIIFWEGTDKFKLKAAKTLSERLAKEPFSQHFEQLSGVQLSGWIQKEIKDRGGSIARPAVQYIVQHVGENMWHLHSLVEQLVAYKNGSEIGIEDARIFLPEHADDNIFNLVDAIVAKRPKDVFNMIRQQYEIGEDAHFIFAMILRQFRILLQLRDIYEREDVVQSDVLAKRLGLHPFVVKKSLPLMKKYSMNVLEEIHYELLEVDRKTKTGQGDQEAMLDFFVGKVAAQ